VYGPVAACSAGAADQLDLVRIEPPLAVLEDRGQLVLGGEWLT
jgi:hypothetical protein